VPAAQPGVANASNKPAIAVLRNKRKKTFRPAEIFIGHNRLFQNGSVTLNVA
jgi:hypothetical protein